ncbi:unnamed protein product [Zymoseptoria tritici ST99CH_3D7]|uniref:Apple domain-containing protein n=1 Tax=Zymoseptoria tritici (strain ST99CH_3D7) TaxID=1276538 RepID=A0A1X7RSU8_ZYMT9|nr:unnamed protein product [Zymoseptoria tritici ST99CH_3D7]
MRFTNLLAIVLSIGSIAVEATPVDKRSALTCGLHGNDGNRYVIQQTRCTRANCAIECRNSKKCKAYSYGNGRCPGQDLGQEDDYYYSQGDYDFGSQADYDICSQDVHYN